MFGWFDVTKTVCTNVKICSVFIQVLVVNTVGYKPRTLFKFCNRYSVNLLLLVKIVKKKNFKTFFTRKYWGGIHNLIVKSLKYGNAVIPE